MVPFRPFSLQLSCSLSNVHREIYDILSLRCMFCSRCRRLESNKRSVALSEMLFLSLGLNGAGVAPLPPCSRKLLDERVETFAVFLSWLHLLDAEDNCMLSVPLSTSDFHHDRWQSGVICQRLSTGSFTLLCHVVLTFLKVCSSSFFVGCCFAHAFVCSMSPVFSAWHCVHPLLSVVATSIGSARDCMWSLISCSRRKLSLQAVLKFEGPAFMWICSWVLPVPLSRRLHRSRPYLPGTLRQPFWIPVEDSF